MMRHLVKMIEVKRCLRRTVTPTSSSPATSPHQAERTRSERGPGRRSRRSCGGESAGSASSKTAVRLDIGVGPTSCRRSAERRESGLEGTGRAGASAPCPPGFRTGADAPARPFGTDSECIVASGGRGCQGARGRPALPTAASGPHTGGRRRTAEACETVIGGNGDEHARAATGAGAVAGRHRPGIALGRPAMVGISAPPAGHRGRSKRPSKTAGTKAAARGPIGDPGPSGLIRTRPSICWARARWREDGSRRPTGPGPACRRVPRSQRNRSWADAEPGGARAVHRDGADHPGRAGGSSGRRDRACPSRSGPSGAFRAAWRRPCVSSRHGGMS